MIITDIMWWYDNTKSPEDMIKFHDMIPTDVVDIVVREVEIW